MEQQHIRSGPEANPIKKFTSRGAKLLCDAAGSNRSAFARSVGISGELLSHLLHGRRKPSLKTAVLLQEKAGVSVTEWSVPFKRAKKKSA